MGKKKPIKIWKKDAIDTIVKHKADNLKKGLCDCEKYNKHIKDVLRQFGINTSNKQVKAFVVGAVDAMIYDVAPTLGFKPSYKKRIKLLKEIFTNNI